MYVPLPDQAAREEFIARELTKLNHELDREEINLLSELTEGYNFVDLDKMFLDLRAIEKMESESLKLSDFKKYLSKTSPSVSQEQQDKYLEFIELLKKEI